MPMNSELVTETEGHQRANTKPVRVAVAGATGFAGQELIRLLARHPFVTITVATGSQSTSSPRRLPALSKIWDGTVVPLNAAAFAAEAVFLALPEAASAELAPTLLQSGLRVIDLSGAFRLEEPSMYPTWYGFDHERPNLLGEAVYGLTEYCNGELKKARLVANPGCYPTSILLALRPLTFAIDREQPVICDSKSGVSGAGKKADVNFSFAELFGNFKAYGVGQHRHEPEIRQQLHLGDRAPVVFVAHLLPVHRGILSTMHIGFTHAMTEQQIADAYTRVYANAPFVRVLPAGQLPELKNVVNTPRAEIGFQLLHGGRRAVIVSVIDNLLKGAASQAVQNFNRMCGFAETEALV